MTRNSTSGARLHPEHDEGAHGDTDTMQTGLEAWQDHATAQQEFTGAESSGYMVAVE